MLREHEAVIERVRQLAAPLTNTERLALIRVIASLDSPEQETSQQNQTSTDALDVEQAAWFALPHAERQHYAGQYVAIHNGQVVDHDPDQRALYLRVRTHFGRQPVLIVNADWNAPPTIVLHSPRLERRDVVSI